MKKSELSFVVTLFFTPIVGHSSPVFAQSALVEIPSATRTLVEVVLHADIHVQSLQSMNPATVEVAEVLDRLVFISNRRSFLSETDAFQLTQKVSELTAREILQNLGLKPATLSNITSIVPAFPAHSELETEYSSANPSKGGIHTIFAVRLLIASDLLKMGKPSPSKTTLKEIISTIDFITSKYATLGFKVDENLRNWNLDDLSMDEESALLQIRRNLLLIEYVDAKLAKLQKQHHISPDSHKKHSSR